MSGRFAGGQGEIASARARLTLDDAPRLIYAIGDVHGSLDLLRTLEQRIVRDASAGADRKLIIMLGDYIDRGPDSAGVLDHLLLPPPRGFERICLVGNHEQMMLDAASAARGGPDWLANGGDIALASYGVPIQQLRGLRPGSAKLRQVILERVPADHIDFLRGLPVAVTFGSLLFVHAAISGAAPLATLPDEELIWARRPAGARLADGLTIVHGHVPQPRVERDGNRIGVDTAAFASGVLSALKIGPDGAMSVLTTGGESPLPPGRIHAVG